MKFLQNNHQVLFISGVGVLLLSLQAVAIAPVAGLLTSLISVALLIGACVGISTK